MIGFSLRVKGIIKISFNITKSIKLKIKVRKIISLTFENLLFAKVSCEINLLSTQQIQLLKKDYMKLNYFSKDKT